MFSLVLLCVIVFSLQLAEFIEGKSLPPPPPSTHFAFIIFLIEGKCLFCNAPPFPLAFFVFVKVAFFVFCFCFAFGFRKRKMFLPTFFFSFFFFCLVKDIFTTTHFFPSEGNASLWVVGWGGGGHLPPPLLVNTHERVLSVIDA